MKKHHKFAALLLAVLLVFSTLSAVQPQEAQAADPTVTVYLNGTKLNQSGIIHQNYTMLPMRTIFEALGCQVEWFGATRSISAYDPVTNQVMALMIDSPVFFIADDTEFTRYSSNINSTASQNYVLAHTSIINVAPIIKNGSTMVPARVVAESLGCTVNWNGSTRTVTISR